MNGVLYNYIYSYSDIVYVVTSAFLYYNTETIRMALLLKGMLEFNLVLECPVHDSIEIRSHIIIMHGQPVCADSRYTMFSIILRALHKLKFTYK